MQYEFVCRWRYAGLPQGELVRTTSAENLHDIIEAFDSFLKGCGFSYDGHVRLIEPDDVA